MYIEGPGDIVGAFDSWSRAEAHPTETSRTFSSQVFEHCIRTGRSFIALSYGGPPSERQGDGFRIANVPRRMWRLPKIGYHLSLLWYFVRIARLIVQYRPTTVVITSGVIQWFACAWLARLGPEVVPVLHNAFWPNGFPYPGCERNLRWWRDSPPRTLAVSPAIRRQLQLAGHAAEQRVTEFRPTFLREHFPRPPTRPHRPEFRILYVGRVEANKGALDLCAIASALRINAPRAFVIDVCGEGAAARDLDMTVAEQQLERVVLRWGRLDRDSLLTRYGNADICIVPTRSDFNEGFAQVVAEAILCGCPVVTSLVVPAAELYPQAVGLAQTDDVASFVNTIRRLMADPGSLASLREGCLQYRDSILEEPATFERALALATS